MQTSGSNRVFHTLDALRGFAAISVVIFHMKGSFQPLAAPGGYLAVDLFFMMSGVVLSHAYEARFRAGMGVLGFMRARLIRLYPLYLLGTLAGVLVTFASLMGHNVNGWTVSGLLSATLLALVFLPKLAGGPGDQIFPLNIPSWSLFFELLVNLLFVLCWPLLSNRRLVATCALTGAVVAGAAVQAGHLDLGSTASTMGVGLARTLFGFAVGVLIARRLAAAPRVSNTWFLGIVAIVAAVTLLQPAGRFQPVWDALSVLVVFPVVVYLATRVDPGPALRRVATFLGVTSYAVYVFHSPLSSVLNSAGRVFSGFPLLQPPVMGFVVLVVLLAGCWLVDRLIDIPVRRYLGARIPRA